MTETTDKTLTAPKKTLGLKRGNIERDTVRQSFSHGRTNTVQVERKKRRINMPGETKAEAPAPAPVAPEPKVAAPAPVPEAPKPPPAPA
ncbi:MAG: translation initiation factor IF-2 associated domain-containing protein, partial [Bauldia litoralis]